MALRAVLKRAKRWAWGYQQLVKHKSGFVGAISSNKSKSMVRHNFLLNSSCSPIPLNHSCRHYYLPPPPPVKIVDECEGGDVVAVGVKEALSSARFAVKMHNEIEGRNIRFVRLVRASGMMVAGVEYYITLEGIDENGDLNVYYAEVFDCVFERMKQLKKWQLVDESFSYPFGDTLESEEIVEKIWCGFEGNGNHAASVPGLCIEGSADLHRKIMNSKENALHITGARSPSSNDDYRKGVYYAFSALEMHNKKTGKEICLKEVLHASREHIDDKVFYILLLKAMDEKRDLKYFYAIVEVFEEELIKCHVFSELSSGPLKKNKMAVGA